MDAIFINLKRNWTPFSDIISKSFDPKSQYLRVGISLKNFILSGVPSFLTASQTHFAKDSGLFL